MSRIREIYPGFKDSQNVNPKNFTFRGEKWSGMNDVTPSTVPGAANYYANRSGFGGLPSAVARNREL